MPINKQLFNPNYSWEEKNGSIVIQVSKDSPLLAHTKIAHTETTDSLSIQGEIEPLVGREWKVDNQAGESVAFSGMCWTPGSIVKTSHYFVIQKFGIWQVKNQV